MRKKRNEKLIQVLALIVILCASAAVLLLIILSSRSRAENYFEEMQNSVNRAEDHGAPAEIDSAGLTDPADCGEQDADTDLAADRNTAAGTVNQSQAGQKDAGAANAPETDILEELGITIPEKNLDWEELKAQNGDIYAWICVPDTLVDYPVVQHPTDNTWYVDHNLDGSKGYPACIYTENFNSRDFTDVHTVLYGHNMKDKSMFGSLHNFENKELFEEDHYIFIYTEEKVFVYEIFAAYDYSDEHLLLNYNLANEYVYEQYLKDIFKIKTTSKRVANIRDDVTVTGENKILTLLTCTRDSNPDYRFLVVGVLLNP